MKSFERAEDECIINKSKNSNILRQNLNIDQIYKIEISYEKHLFIINNSICIQLIYLFT